MTRTSMAHVAVVAAVVSAGALGYAVLWSYDPPDEAVPPAVSAAQPPETPPVAPSAPPAEVTVAPVESAQSPAPPEPVQSAPAAPSAEHKIVSMPAAEPPKVAEPVPSRERPETKSAAEAATARHANSPTQKVGAVAAPSAPPSTVRPTIDSSLGITAAQAAPAVPAPSAHQAAATPKASMTAPQREASVAVAPLADPTPVTEARPAPAPTPPVASGAPVGHAASAPLKLRSLAPQSDAPQATSPTVEAALPAPAVESRTSPPPAGIGHVIAPSARLHAVPQANEPAPRAAEPERAIPRRLAAVLPQSEMPRRPVAIDAPPVLVLRGGPPAAHYAQAGKPQAPQSVIKVVRGARPLPTGLEGIVQPGALLLRVPE